MAIKIQPIDQNNGLLPLKIGNALIKTSQWTLVRNYNLTDVIEEFNELKISHDNIINTILESKFKIFQGQMKIVEIQKDRIEKQLQQLLPSKFLRIKRGVINGLGSIIKVITGNLDEEDAKRYDQSIKELTNNQNDLITTQKEQIFIMKDCITKFHNDTQKLLSSQNLIRNHLKMIDAYINTTTETQQILFIHLTLSQLATSYQLIFDHFEQIETALTFSKLNTLHNTIVDPETFLEELTKLNKMSTNKLPFQPSKENLVIIERLASIKSYQKDCELTFLITVPVTNNKYYEYFRLLPIPVNVNSSMQIIVPKNKFLIIDEQNYHLNNEACLEISNNYFCTNQIELLPIIEKTPCEVAIVRSQSVINNCNIIKTNVNELIVKTLMNNLLYVFSSKSINVMSICDNKKSSFNIIHSNLIDLENCAINISNKMYKGYTKSKLKLEFFNLPRINFETSNYVKPEISFDTVNDNELEDYNKLYQLLNINEHHINKLSSKTEIKNNLIFGIIILTMIVSFCVFKIKMLKRRKTRRQDIKDIGTEDNPVALV